MTEYGPLLVLGVFAFVGVIMLAHGLARFRFVETTGTVVSAEVVTRSVGPDSDIHSLSLVIEYEYGGTTLRGSPMSYSASGSLSRGSWEQRASSYPPGSVVAVFCDPENPERFVVDRRVDPREFIVAVTLLLVGAVGAWLVVRKQ